MVPFPTLSLEHELQSQFPLPQIGKLLWGHGWAWGKFFGSKVAGIWVEISSVSGGRIWKSRFEQQRQETEASASTPLSTHSTINTTANSGKHVARRAPGVNRRMMGEMPANRDNIRRMISIHEGPGEGPDSSTACKKQPGSESQPGRRV